MLCTDAPGGEFPPHKDHQALTVIVPLSDHGGGGTGFWVCEQEEGDGSCDENTVDAAECEEMRANGTSEATADDDWGENGWDDGWQDDWEDDWEAEEWRGMERPVIPPSTVLRPERGTAMLFSGEVLHAGMPVERDSRVVLVASFSGMRFWPDKWHRPLGAASYAVMTAVTVY